MVSLGTDIGGTKSLFELFDHDGRELQRIEYRSSDYKSIQELLQQFLVDSNLHGTLTTCCLAVPGPVVGNNRCKPTNLSWPTFSVEELKELLGVDVIMVNDTVATAVGCLSLHSSGEPVDELHQGLPNGASSAAVIAPGTGLGVALLQYDGRRHCPQPTELGHCGFAPQDDLQHELWGFLARRFGYVSVERILSGNGILELYDFLKSKYRGSPDVATQVAEVGTPAPIFAAALAQTCPLSIEVYRVWFSILGAAAGNLALCHVPMHGGIYIAGGIVARVRELACRFRHEIVRAFLAKGPMSGLVKSVPLRLVARPDAALRGAVSIARRLNSLDETVTQSADHGKLLESAR